jgi:hypothetical protein
MPLNPALTRAITRELTRSKTRAAAGGGVVDAQNPTFSNTVIVQSNFEGTEDAAVGEADDRNTTNWTAATATYQDGGSGRLFGSNRAYVGGATQWIGVAAGGTPAWDINTQDFCIEVIHEFADISADRCITASRATPASDKCWELWWDQSENELVWEDFTDGTAATKAQVRWALTPSVGTNYEIVIGRDTNGIRCLVNGTQIGSDTAHTRDIFWKAGIHVFCGYNNDSTDIRYDVGYFDCFRFTIGECHVTENYTQRTGTDTYPTS